MSVGLGGSGCAALSTVGERCPRVGWGVEIEIFCASWACARLGLQQAGLAFRPVPFSDRASRSGTPREAGALCPSRLGEAGARPCGYAATTREERREETKSRRGVTRLPPLWLNLMGDAEFFSVLADSQLLRSCRVPKTGANHGVHGIVFSDIRIQGLCTFITFGSWCGRMVNIHS